jgi:hypothetical protein
MGKTEMVILFSFLETSPVVSFAPHPVSSTAWPMYLSSLVVGELKTKKKKNILKTI